MTDFGFAIDTPSKTVICVNTWTVDWIRQLEDPISIDLATAIARYVVAQNLPGIDTEGWVLGADDNVVEYLTAHMVDEGYEIVTVTTQ